jgi:hypothetical protein
MAMTKSTTITWGSKEGWQNPQLAEARNAKLSEMQTAGKTDLSINNEDPETELIWTRFWINEAAAEEYIGFIITRAATLNLVIVSTEIGDYTAPV